MGGWGGGEPDGFAGSQSMGHNKMLAQTAFIVNLIINVSPFRLVSSG